LELLRTILTSQGAEVTTAISAKDAVDCLGRELPDLIVSDIEMPGGDGCAFIRAVRGAQDGAWRTLPVVALTAYSRVEDRIRLLSAGFSMHVSKPADPAELAAIILSLTRRPARE
jgi:CheY-like chemotaxis protein